MSKQATATISVNVTGDGLNFTDTDSPTNASSGVAPTSATLAAGFNAIPVPSGVTRVKIKPPPSSAVALTLKGVTGDTGIPISPAEPSYLSLPTGATTFGITAGGAVTLLLAWC